MKHAAGGELLHRSRIRHRLPEEEAKFYVAGRLQTLCSTCIERSANNILAIAYPTVKATQETSPASHDTETMRRDEILKNRKF